MYFILILPLNIFSGNFVWVFINKNLNILFLFFSLLYLIKKNQSCSTDFFFFFASRVSNDVRNTNYLSEIQLQYIIFKYILIYLTLDMMMYAICLVIFKYNI